jgi:thiamine-phosphate pyrophosphorylase
VIVPQIVLVTDPTFSDEAIVRCIEAAGLALPPGALCVQLRDKRRARCSLRVFAGQLRVVTRRVGASFVVNGDAHLARDVGADGVHLGGGAATPAQTRAILGRGWISVAAHDDGDVERAVTGGADAVLVSPIFPTRSGSLPGAEKKPRGRAALASARNVAGRKLAVYALGGVTHETASSCVAAGADGVAVVRVLLASPDPARSARRLHDAILRRW